VIVGLVVAAVAVVVIVSLSHNRFVSQSQLIRESWADVDTELQRRHDLIPNLVEVVKGYAAHERAVLEAVVRARAGASGSSASAAAQSRDEGELVVALRQLLAVSEAYPQLKASEQFLALQRQLATTEDRIQLARRIYNGNVRDYNRRIESVPSSLVARIGHFFTAEYFDVDPVVRVSPEVA
jgi:LemA protein